MINKLMQKSFLSHKIRLRPTPEQEKTLKDWSDACRFVWNHFLALNKEKYEKEKKFIFYYDMSLLLTQLKKEEGKEFLKEPSAWCLQNTCQTLEAAIKSVWKKGKGFPKFKSKKRGDQPGLYLHLPLSRTKKQVKLPKLGWIRWYKNRSFSGKLTSIRVVYDSGYWWITCSCEIMIPDKIIHEDSIGGIDLGLKNWITTSDGEVFDLHPDLIDREKKVIKEQRRLAKKTKDSQNYQKQKMKLKRAHLNVRFARNDNAHTTSAAIAKQYSCVAVEDLNIKGMIKNRHLARKIAQVSWSQFITYLSYKTIVKKIDRWYPSTKTCSSCGNKRPMPLDVRLYVCGGCGMELDRDHNAAINIRNQITTVTVENYACGDVNTGGASALAPRHTSLNQEKVETCSEELLVKIPRNR